MSDEILTIEETSELTRTPVATLRWWRAMGRGDGPPSMKVGYRVRYRRSAVEAWLAECDQAA